MVTTCTVDLVAEGADELIMLVDPGSLLASMEEVTRLVNKVVGRKELPFPFFLPVYIVLATVPVPVLVCLAGIVLLAKKDGKVTFAIVLMAVTVVVVTGRSAVLVV